MRIESIRVYHVSQPLLEPYHLSYGSVHALESIWVRVEVRDGTSGWGESTPLPGYSDTDFATAWGRTNLLASAWIGGDLTTVLGSPPRSEDGFAFTALWSALEEASGLVPNLSGEVPLVGLVQERADEFPVSALARVRDFGYRVFKVKAGFLAESLDAERLVAFQASLREGERLRIDANQSLSEAQAGRLLSVCSPDYVELFEQPLPVAAWDACARLAAKTQIPLMLDESITDLASLRRTKQSGAARMIKLKWMKQGGKKYLDEMVDLAQDLGLKVVFGNGVAGAINNRLEAIYYTERLRIFGLAGEMNGYLKLGQTGESLGFSNGSLRMSSRPDGWEPSMPVVLSAAEYLA